MGPGLFISPLYPVRSSPACGSLRLTRIGISNLASADVTGPNSEVACQGGCGLGGTPKPNGSVKSLQVEHAVLEMV